MAAMTTKMKRPLSWMMHPEQEVVMEYMEGIMAAMVAVMMLAMLIL